MALIGMILALVFVIVTLVGPWYTMSSSMTILTNEVKMEGSMSLISTTTTTTSGGTAKTETESNADARKAAEDLGQDASYYDIFNNTLYLTIVALLVAILALVFVLGYVFNFGKVVMMKNLGMVFGIVTFVMALIAVFYFMTAVPAKMNSYGADVGFWYSNTVEGATVSLGPGFAWYLMIVAGIIALISFVFIFMDRSAAPVYKNPAQ